MIQDDINLFFVNKIQKRTVFPFFLMRILCLQTVLRMGLLISLLIFWVMMPFARAGIPPVTSDGRVVSLAPMLQEVTPTVVNISVTNPSSFTGNPLFNDPFFQQFFGSLPRNTPQKSAGSGVIIDAERGIIVTNHHVIAKARSIKVTLKDRRSIDARLIGIDPSTDIAVIAIDAERLKAIPLGNSDSVEVGDYVAAIGNPFAIGQTVTSGIVSALGRSGLNVGQFEDFIQTDAAINPGNSGGALINLKGELIGINSSIISPARASAGIGFAIPVNMMKAVVEQILRNGRVERGVFGIEVQDLRPELLKNLGIPLREGAELEGALLARVFPNTAAAVAGLFAGDVVIALDGRPIRSANHLRSQLALLPPGTLMRLQILRFGETLTLEATMGTKYAARTPQRPTIKRRSPTQEAPNSSEDDAFLPLQPDLGLKVAQSDAGVIVTELSANSLAARWGIKVGDIILQLNGQEINTVEDIPEIQANRINITLRRGNAIIRLIRK